MKIAQNCLFAVLPLLFSSCATASGPIAADVVFAPNFRTTQGDIPAGKAFVVTSAKCGPLMLSAYHLFGPSGGLNAQVPVGELTALIKSIVLHNISTDKPVFTVKGNSVTPQGASLAAPVKGPGDIFAFRSTTDLSSVAMPVSTRPVKKGDRVRVLTSVIGNADATSFDAVVAGMQDGYLIYDLVKPGFVIRATSGAPVVDADGRVVAINLGGGRYQGTEQVYGMGNPATAWVGALETQCK